MIGYGGCRCAWLCVTQECAVCRGHDGSAYHALNPEAHRQQPHVDLTHINTACTVALPYPCKRGLNTR
jgi:hypothetical protein